MTFVLSVSQPNFIFELKQSYKYIMLALEVQLFFYYLSLINKVSVLTMYGKAKLIFWCEAKLTKYGKGEQAKLYLRNKTCLYEVRASMAYFVGKEIGTIVRLTS